MTAGDNIILIGMPTSGKTTVSMALAEKTGRKRYEMDYMIMEKLGTDIRTCFETHGEEYFRKIETETAKELASVRGSIISCGGGVIKIPETMQWLKSCGTVIWLKRDPAKLYPTDSRPLSSTKENLQRIYEERLPLYEKYADITADNNGTVEETVQQIMDICGLKAGGAS
ncbi:MAG: shikimate kinase [Solobacterium sp.]|nr:shikimate kinase [Solobacterium sp.]